MLRKMRCAEESVTGRPDGPTRVETADVVGHSNMGQ